MLEGFCKTNVVSQNKARGSLGSTPQWSPTGLLEKFPLILGVVEWEVSNRSHLQCWRWIWEEILEAVRLFRWQTVAWPSRWVSGVMSLSFQRLMIPRRRCTALSWLWEVVWCSIKLKNFSSTEFSTRCHLHSGELLKMWMWSQDLRCVVSCCRLDSTEIKPALVTSDYNACGRLVTGEFWGLGEIKKITFQRITNMAEVLYSGLDFFWFGVFVF